MAEVVRRRYSRLLSESQVSGLKSKDEAEARDEGGEAIAQELQKLIDETSKQVRRKRKAKSEDGRLKMEDGRQAAGGQNPANAVANETTQPEVLK
jgi:hypothetical protein